MIVIGDHATTQPDRTAGRRTRRPALALDIRRFDAPRHQFPAFPAEEPPSIECNEDAAGEDSDD